MRRSKHRYILIILLLVVLSVIGHWLFGWLEYLDEMRRNAQALDFQKWAMQMVNETRVNWRSEVPQLIWQVACLTFLWYLGSPRLKQGDSRREEKLDEILKKLDPDGAYETLDSLERKYPRR
jgi:hypothetical protein